MANNTTNFANDLFEQFLDIMYQKHQKGDQIYEKNLRSPKLREVKMDTFFNRKLLTKKTAIVGVRTF